MRTLLWACTASLLALGAAGCADHGPVDIFSRELFNKDVVPARLDFAVATPLSPAAGVVSAPSLVGVSLINNGAASTYGPLVVTFSSTDLQVTLVPVAAGGPVLAFGADSPGKEVRASTAFIPLAGGYQSGGSNIETLGSSSFQFYYSGAHAPFTPVTIFMKIQDALGNVWNTQFLLYVQ